MKECELCDRPARMYCESDQASLCWDCDAKVHCANFLVARHSRNLLCHNCQSPTPWKASGEKLGPTVSVCERCVSSCDGRIDRAEQQQEEEEDDGENEDEEIDDEEDEDEEEIDDDYEDDDDVDEEEEEEDGENQVVPWSSTPPPVPSSSSSEDSSSRLVRASSETTFPLKRMRENADLRSEDDLGCSSSQHRAASVVAAACDSAEQEAPSLDSFQPSNDRKKMAKVRSDSRSSVIDSLQRFQREVVCNEDDVLDICKMSKDPGAVDLVSTSSRSPSI